MNITKIDIDKLVENPLNVRQHGTKQIDELVKSINSFEVVRPIVCDENFTILCGHGLYKALKQMGRTEADVLVKSGLTDNQKKKLLLSDNKIFSLGFDDFDSIEELIKSLDGDFEIPGYDSSVLDELYGVGSIDEEQAQTISKKAQEIGNEPNSAENTPKEDRQPSNAVVEARQKFEENKQSMSKYVICPNCGERIEIE